MATRRFLKRHSWLSVCPVSNSRLFSASSGLYKSPPFQRAKRGPFYQDPPTLYNPFVEDVTTRSFLKRILPDKVVPAAFEDFEKFGDRIVEEVDGLGREVERNPPSLIHYDAYGRRVDELITDHSWYKLHDISAEEGLISTAYRGPYGEWNRLCQMVKLYLFAPSSGLYSCPLAMTDGATKILKPLKDSRYINAYDHLTSQSPDKFWTSGQWMTERKGGSDVAAGTETLAIPQANEEYKLYGYKWFTSATDADMTLTLARVQDDQGNITDGTRGLSLFYLETKDAGGNYNNIELQRLKDKLGTRQLPTAELLLDGTIAYKISETGKGVAAIAPMLTITRIHNSISAVSAMRRILQLSRDYCTKREVFRRYLADTPLHMQTLARMEVDTKGCVLFTLDVCRLLSLEESDMCTDTQSYLLRLLVPVLKLYTAKKAVATTSEGLESFGGFGYLEDTGLPVFLRDSQVLPIWEGTTNVLAMDVLRSIVKSNGKAFEAYCWEINNRLIECKKPGTMDEEVKTSIANLNQITNFFKTASSNGDVLTLELAGRDFAYAIAQVYVGLVLIEQATSTQATITDRIAATRWCGQALPIQTIDCYTKETTNMDKLLVMDGYKLQRDRP
ncbi:acyl-CoA dehydrogenase family member 11-like [Dysidea avara]|uniref:acyl-CoA dehydrogenase family member 11-like n=1 Tax=Dysidea avara TaxID=196820 RepID=UPI0033259C3E